MVMEAVTAEWFAIELCKKLGIDPDMTMRIVIDLPPGQPVQVYIGQVNDGSLLDLPWDKAKMDIWKVRD